MRFLWDIQVEVEPLTMLVGAGDRHLEAESMGVVSAYGIDHYGRGYGVRGDTGQDRALRKGHL